MSIFHICQVLLYRFVQQTWRFQKSKWRECEILKQMLEERGREDCLLTNGLICTTATGRLNTGSELLVLLCKCVLMGFSSGLQGMWLMQLLILHSPPPPPPPPGQIQDVSLSQEDPAPQVEVTPELDLEVVPESSGDWHNVFPWPQTRKALHSVLSSDWVLQLNSKALTNMFLLSKQVIWLEKRLKTL